MLNKLFSTSSKAIHVSFMAFITYRQLNFFHAHVPKLRFNSSTINNDVKKLDEAQHNREQKEAKEIFENQTQKVVELQNSEDFEAVVVNTKEPIVLDLYADWCEPCKLLTPRLESKINSIEGVKLVKINIDKCPEIAKVLAIQSVPTIYLIYQGQAIDKIEGNVDELEFNAFFEMIEKITSDNPLNQEAINILESAKARMSENKIEEAKEILEKFEAAKIGVDIEAVKELLLAQCYLMLDKTGELEESIERASRFVEFYAEVPDLNEFYHALVKQSNNLSKKQTNPHVAHLQSKITNAANKDELLESKFDLAKEYKNEEQFEKSLEVALEIIKEDKNWCDKKVNKFVLEVFKELGNSSPIVQKYRKLLQRLIS